MKTHLFYKSLIALLLGSALVILYGIVAHLFDIKLFSASLPYALIVFQAVALLIMLYKIIVNIRLKKPIGNLLGVTAAMAIFFIGSTYLYIAIMEAIGK